MTTTVVDTTPRPFVRSMKVFGVLMLTLSAITPASSVFVIIPGIIQQAGSGALISLAAAALIALAMAFVFAEIASAWPLSGGDYAMVGRTLGPFPAFVLMGAKMVFAVVVTPTLALGAGAYLAGVWPGAPPVPIAVALVGLATLCGILNIRLNAWVTGAFLMVEVVALAVLAALGFGHGVRPLSEVLAHPVVVSAGALAPASLSAIALATTVAIFAYDGFGAAVYFSEEMHEAPRRIARTILWALAVTLVLEFIPTLAVILGAPDLKALIASASPFGDFAYAMGGRAVGVAISLGVALAIFNAVIAILMVQARMIYSSGRDQAWHGAINAVFTRLHGRFDSPWPATVITGVAGMAACFAPFHLLLVLAGMNVVVSYALVCLAVIAGRVRGTTAHAPYRMPLFPLAPVVVLAALAGVAVANWTDPDVGRPSLIAAAALLGLFAAYYGLMRRWKRLRWVLAGPATSPNLTTGPRNLEPA